MIAGRQIGSKSLRRIADSRGASRGNNSEMGIILQGGYPPERDHSAQVGDQG